jgi:type IV secretion system protein VirB8
VRAVETGLEDAMSIVTPGERDAYFATARTFDQDRLLAADRSRRLAWAVAAGATVLASCAVLAVAALAPLKTVEPFVVRVDNSTGIVDVVSALTGASGSYDDAITKYFAAAYVRVREGYTHAEAESNFRAGTLLSVPDEQLRFAALYRGSNPESPQNVWGRTAAARVQIKSISMISPAVVSVRYLRTVIRGEDSRTTHWVATLTYSYLATPLAQADRLINPLGFAVSQYRSDTEAVQ